MRLPKKNKKVDWARVIALCRNINGTVSPVSHDHHLRTCLVLKSMGLPVTDVQKMVHGDLPAFTKAAKALGYGVLVSRYGGIKCVG